MNPIPFSARALLPLLLASLLTSTALAGTVTGTIQSADTRQPLAGKVVAAYDTAGTLRGTATSDPAGTYVLALPAGGYHLLAYDLEGTYATMFDSNADSFETSPVTPVPETGTVRRDFALVVGGTITGSVVASTGAPQQDVVVEAYNLSGTRRGFTSTDAQGRYSIVLPPGHYKLIAYDAAGHYSFSFYPGVRTFAEAAPVPVSAARTSAADFRLEAAGRISGSVIDLATGLPLGGITVYAYTPDGVEVTSTTTDAAGVFRLSVPAGGYKLVAADPARRYATGFFGDNRSFEAAVVVGLSGGDAIANLQLGLVRGATIAGRVRDAAGTPVANVTAAAYNLDGTLHAAARTGDDGTYELLVAPGTYKIVVFDAQLVYATSFFGNARDFASSGPVGIAAGQALRGFDLSVIHGGRVSGTVREGSQPRGGITVAAYDAAGVLVASTVTAADGTYGLVVPPGDYRLVAFDTNVRYAPAYDNGAATFDQTVPRTIGADASVTADFSIRRGVTVTFDVLDANGQPVSGVNVFALDAAGNRVSGGTSANGIASLAVPAGAYRFAAIDPSGRYATEYYFEATTLDSAAVVTVGTDELPPRPRFTLEQTMRRRVVRH